MPHDLTDGQQPIVIETAVGDDDLKAIWNTRQKDDRMTR